MQLSNAVMAVVGMIRIQDVAAALVSALALVLPFVVSRAGNRIAERQGRVQLLEFAHQRIRSVNLAARGLATDLEQITFAIGDMVRNSFEFRYEAESKGDGGEKTPSEAQVREKVRETIRQAIIADYSQERELSDAQKSFRQSYDRFTSILEDLPELLRSFAADPFVTAATRLVMAKRNADSLPEKVNKLLGRQRYQTDALGVARLMKENSRDPAARIAFLHEAFYAAPYYEDDLLGLMFDYDFFWVLQDKTRNKTHDAGIEFYVVNSGMIYLSLMYSMLPSKDDVSELFDGLTRDRTSDQIGIDYAQLTGVDFPQIVDNEHLKMFQRYNVDPESLVIVGRRTVKHDGEDNDQIEWESYSREKHGPLAALNAF